MEFRKYTDYHFNLLFWQNYFGAWRAEILTQFGLCYAFNIIEDENLFNLREISADFRYKHELTKSAEQSAINFTTPLRTNHKSMGIYYYLDDYKKEFYEREVHWILSDYDGLLMLIHDPSELPTVDSVQVYAVVTNMIEVFVTPEITTIDESLEDVSIEE